jgi:predicted dithiol-disulfide oxidoreductase (DUF899 family)
LPLYQDVFFEFSRDHHAPTENGGDDAAFNLFTRKGGTIRHFWGGEMVGASSDCGQEPRGAPDLMPIWSILDVDAQGARDGLVIQGCVIEGTLRERRAICSAYVPVKPAHFVSNWDCPTTART